MRLYLAVALAVLVLAISAGAASLAIAPGNITITIEPGEQGTASFILQNTGAVDVSNITFSHSIDTADNDDDTLTLRFSDPGTVLAGKNATVTVTATGDSRLDFNDYKGTVTATGNGEQASTELTVSVAPDICDFGVARNDLSWSVKDPDNGDDFEPGEEMQIEANVKNKGSSDIDVKVEAFLFGDEEEIVGASSQVKNVDDDDSEDFEFTLKIPVDSRRIESGKNYKLFVKAFDDDRERENCVQEGMSIDIKLENDKLAFDRDETQFEPSIVSCGDIATALIKVVNIGDENQEDAYFTLRNAALGVNERTNAIDIDDFDSDENNAASRRIQFTVPEDAREGTYAFDATVHYSEKTTSTSLPLTVDACGGAPSPASFDGTSQLDLQTSAFTAAPGDSISIPAAVANHGDAGIFSVEVQNFEDFAEPLNSPLLQLGSSQQRTVFVNIVVLDDAVPSRYSGSLLLLKNGMVIDSKDFFIDVQMPAVEEQPSVIDSLLAAPLWFQIILGAAVLGALLALVIVLA